MYRYRYDFSRKNFHRIRRKLCVKKTVYATPFSLESPKLSGSAILTVRNGNLQEVPVTVPSINQKPNL